MDGKNKKIWHRKLALSIIYTFLLLGGVSLAYAAGISRHAVLEAEIGHLQAQVNQNQYQGYHNTHSEYQANKDRLQGLLAEAQDKLEEASPSDAFSLQYQIMSYQSQIEELDKKMRDTALQEKLYEYYDSNFDLITGKTKTKADYSDFQNAWKLTVLQGQLDYLELAREEAEARLGIAVAKREMGYALEIEVMEAELALDGIDIQYDSTEENIEYLRSELLSGEWPDFRETIPSIQSETDYYARFLENSTTHKYYQNQQKAYEEYGKTFERLASPSEAERIAWEGAGLQAGLAQAQMQQYEQKLGQYIHSLITDYRNARKQYDIKEQEIELCSEKKKRISLLYEQGEVQYVDLLAIEAQYKKLESEALSYCGQANDAAYKLKNCIEE